MSADVAIVVFPGSNCDRDAYHAFADILGRKTVYHWYKEPVSKDYKAVILPGGFSYGDYLRSGALAKVSPVVESLGEFIEKGGVVLGICNGFQVLVESGYLPGALVRNRSLHFQCHDVYLKVENNRSQFLSNLENGRVLRMPIAHADGCYVADDDALKEMKRNSQVALRYCSAAGDVSDEFNANGSLYSIAGITNPKGNVMGLMPHPERCVEEILGNTDGLELLKSMTRHF